jgi:hypothetical protein
MPIVSSFPLLEKMPNILKMDPRKPARKAPRQSVHGDIWVALHRFSHQKEVCAIVLST